MNVNFSIQNIFAVTSDPIISKELKSAFSKKFQLSFFPEWENCFENMDQKPRVIFFEVSDDSNWGFSFLDRLNNFDKNISIIIIQKNNNTSSFDFLSKPNVFHCLKKEKITKEYLPFLVKNIERIIELQINLENAQSKINLNFEDQIVSNCEAMKKVFQLAEKAAKTNINCYISGEKGTGKATIANFIHNISNRKSSPFVYCNLNSALANEMEHEFFGVENSSRHIIQKGKFELAKKGTLYIEDIDLLPLEIQAKLVTALQSKKFQRVNGTDWIPLNVRLVVSAKGILFEEMDAGNFLESLYYLLMGLPIPIPPLRERGSDILILAKKFMEQFSLKNKVAKKELTNKAKKKLLDYFFPGNIIELKSTIDRAMVLANKNQITEEEIEFLNTPSHLHFLDSDMTFEEYKSKIIHHYLERYQGDIMQVSHKLDIGKSTIYRMLKSEKEKDQKKMSWLNMF